MRHLGNDDIPALRDMLNDRAEGLARHLLGEPNAAMSRPTKELRFGSRGSLAVVIAGAKAGSFFDHEAGVGGDLFALIAHKCGGGFTDALEFARGFVGGSLVRSSVAVRHVERPVGNGAGEAADLRTARFIWSQRRAIDRSTAATNYIRKARAYGGAIPPTIGYLAARDQYQHAIICAFGIPDEIEPGVLSMADDAVRGVHLIRLNADGSDRDRDNHCCKITLGRCMGSPIVCAPYSDCSNALVIAEGVEDALSTAAAMGIGAWASGGAARMLALAEAIPDYVDCVTVCTDDDTAGQSNSVKLARRLRERGLEIRLTPPFLTGGIT